MAGFDAVFSFRPADRSVLDACLSAARRRARVFQVRFHSEVQDSGLAYIRLDGQTYALDIYVERLRRDLPTIAEAGTSNRKPAGRRRLALGLIDILNRSRGGLYDRYPEGWCPTLRGRSEPAYLLPHEIFALGAPSLQGRLAVTMEMLVSWHYEEIAPEVLIEEIHTAAELLLEATVNSRAQRLSFAQLVDKAHEQELLRSYPHFERPDFRRRFNELPRDDPDSHAHLLNDLGREVLLSLKDCRKQVRHRGAGGAKQWLDEHFWEVVAVLENLAPHARDRPVRTSTTSS